MAVNYDNLVMGKKTVQKTVAAAAEMDYGIITVALNSKRCVAEKQIWNFEVLKPFFNGGGVGDDYVATIGAACFYPDGKGNRRAFLIDSDFNKNQLAKSLANNMFTVTREYRKEIESIAIENNWPLVAPKALDPYSKETAREQTLAKQLTNKQETEIQLQHKLDDSKSVEKDLQAQIAKLQQQLQRQEVDSYDAKTKADAMANQITKTEINLEKATTERKDADMIIPAKVELSDDGEVTEVPAKKAPRKTTKK